MIDRGRLRRLLIVATVLCSLASAIALLAGAGKLAGGVALGCFLGALPFASWAWVVARGLTSARTRILAVVLLAVKLAVYSGALYFLMTRELVHPLGVASGITAVVATVSVGALLPPASAKEAA